MPARAKVVGRLAGLVESDSEPDLDFLVSTESGAARDSAHTMAAAKRPRGRPPAANTNRVTKPAPKGAGRRTSSAKAAAAAQASGRPALVDKSNTNATRTPNPDGKGVLDEDEMDVLDQPEEPPRTKAGRGRPRVSNARAGRASKVNGSDARTKRSAVEEVLETQQPEHMEVEEEVEATDPAAASNAVPETSAKEIEVDYETSDVSLRRRLGELSRKYESLETRHRDLREVGVKEAERNFDRLRKQAEENATVSAKLISELKEELRIQSAQARRCDQMRVELENSEIKVDSLESQVTQLNKSLAQARAEIKTLSTKLAASRNAEANMKAPGSALKANSAAGRGQAPSEVVQAAQAKEDLYGDLTGLIVRGVKRGEVEDVFDCIQTGRNGTLHFKLAVDAAEAADSYEDVQFTYKPQLDQDRDGDLMDVLPDYLVEEITFPRPHASKFYARVIKSLTERLE